MYITDGGDDFFGSRATRGVHGNRAVLPQRNAFAVDPSVRSAQHKLLRTRDQCSGPSDAIRVKGRALDVERSRCRLSVDLNGEIRSHLLTPDETRLAESF